MPNWKTALRSARLRSLKSRRRRRRFARRNSCPPGHLRKAIVSLVLEAKPQAISGVSAGTEAEIMTAYPSLAATSAGRAIGSLCDAVPLKTHGIPWWRLMIAAVLALFVVPVAGTIGLILYCITKITGQRFVLTNRNL